MIFSNEKSYKWIVLLITSIGSMMGPLDGTIIADRLNIDFVSVVWIPAAYLVTLSVFLLIIGRLSDIHGRKWIFITGFAIFILGSFLCSIARTGLELIVVLVFLLQHLQSSQMFFQPRSEAKL